MNWLRNKNRITGKVLTEMVRRIERAYEIIEMNETQPLIFQSESSVNLFDVRSTVDSDKMYKVDAETKTCTCPDFCFRYLKCKHIIAAEFMLRRLN